MKQKKIGLFFGSFNPIHIGHLIIAQTMYQETDLDEIWFVVSPQNPFKQKASLLAESIRLELVEKAIENQPKFRASNVEFNLPKPSYTIDTLKYLEERHGNQYEFHLIMGSDNLLHFHKWKNANVILDSHKIYAYNRPGSEQTDLHQHSSVTLIDGALMHISASYIRKLLKEKKSIQYLVLDSVKEFIEKFNYYQ